MSSPAVPLEPAPRRVLPLLLLLFQGTAWGLTFPTSKIAVENGIGPAAYVFWQTLGAGAVLLVVAVARRRLPRWDLRHLAYYAYCGLVGITLPNAILLAAMAHMTASVQALIVNLSPLVTLAMALTIGMEPFQKRRALGLAIGFGGAGLLVMNGAGLGGSAALGWLLIAFLGPLCYASVSVFNQRFRPPGSDSLSLACGMLIVGFLGAAPLAAIRGEIQPLWPVGPGELAVMIQIAASCCGTVVQFEVIRMAGAVFFSQVTYMTAASALIWSYLLLDESLTPLQGLAMLLIFAGLVLVNWPGTQRAIVPSPVQGEG
ncbi:MAG TPA: DMT family transporter [Hypericibacter adhaerens]|uniref:DMT family transporter n=1 Tax=Hypericibacter adhaerens TaxID=2602016 RepID=UPI002C5FBA2D|nr:DMT family transporter [Hypericibacter adhaerens]HWA45926.1 DMT family transporter [Hypericibacter adhaerens]